MIRISKHNGRQRLFRLDFNDCHISLRINANHLARENPLICQTNLNLLSTGNHMLIGEDITIITEYKTGAKTPFTLLRAWHPKKLTKKLLEKRT